MFRKIMTLAIITGALAVSACNTVKGAGDDLKSASNTGKEVIN